MHPVQADREGRIDAVAAELLKLRVTVAVGSSGPRLADGEVRRLAESAVDAVTAADAAATRRRDDELRERGERMRRDIEEGRAVPK